MADDDRPMLAAHDDFDVQHARVEALHAAQRTLAHGPPTSAGDVLRVAELYEQWLRLADHVDRLVVQADADQYDQRLGRASAQVPNAQLAVLAAHARDLLVALDDPDADMAGAARQLTNTLDHVAPRG